MDFFFPLPPVGTVLHGQEVPREKAAKTDPQTQQSNKNRTTTSSSRRMLTPRPGSRLPIATPTPKPHSAYHSHIQHCLIRALTRLSRSLRGITAPSHPSQWPVSCGERLNASKKWVPSSISRASWLSFCWWYAPAHTSEICGRQYLMVARCDNAG